MLSVLATPELIEHVETPHLPAERSQARHAHLGCLQTLAHWVARHMIRAPHVRQAPLSGVHRPFETPMDRFAREYPSLSLYALALI
jgi:hypothetical protein